MEAHSPCVFGVCNAMFRFAEHGWPQCSLADMRSVYENFLPKAERERVQVMLMPVRMPAGNALSFHLFDPNRTLDHSIPVFASTCECEGACCRP